MHVIHKFFLKGLVVVLPVTITIYILVLVATRAERVFGGFIKSLVGEGFYVPGLGILVTFLLIFAVGVLVSNFLTARLVHWAILKFENFPLVKAIYRPLKDLISLFATSDGANGMKKVVMVEMEQLGMTCLGVVTREEFPELEGLEEIKSQIAVYIPMGYMIGGFTVFVDRKHVKEIDMSVDQAFKLAITGWVTTSGNGNS